ncbi:hypothetical protein [Metabacillus litoralis]|uniref:hypothetical protein n=1 Tax=Metabacillus litoralis TaxID=152268 RepID=UPI00203FDB3B|nr:hypothetical protein [Metabacillus litoralis]
MERAAKNGVSRGMLHNRIRKGWDIEKAITTPKISLSEAGRMSAASQPRWNIN